MYNENDYQLEDGDFHASPPKQDIFHQKNFSFSTDHCGLYRWTVSFVFIPNVQPMSALFILVAFSYRLSDALMIALLSLLGTNIYLGMGPWTISQFAALLSLSFFFISLEKYRSSRNRLLQAFFAFLCGLLMA